MPAIQPSNAEFRTNYARALAGALIFAFPLLMTMEMWWFGMYMDRGRLALFILVFLPMLTGLSRYSGFRQTANWYDDSIDALVAFSAGILVSVVFLAVFAVLGPGMSIDEIIGKIGVLSIPGSMGAVIASKNLGSSDRNEEEDAHSSYSGELFIMGAGAVYLAFNVAPTEEMVLIAYKMGFGHTIVLVLLSLFIMHALVYSLEFRGQHEPDNQSFFSLAVNFTVAGYAISLLVSAYVLWTFGRFDGMALDEAITSTAVLGFPAALGASTARLII